MRVFVCYSKQDEGFASEIIAILRRRGMMTYAGNAFQTESRWQSNLQISSVMLYILSKASAQSEQCNRQRQYALDHNKHMIILKLDDAEMPEEMRRMNIVDYLDFAEIGRQIADGIPGLQKDRYAIEVTLKILIAELAEVQRQEAASEDDEVDTSPLEEDEEHDPPKDPIKRGHREE